jgi:Spy/CpxP family protein refolding chaperone
VTARHIRLSHVSGLVLGLGLLITVPTIGSERQTPGSAQAAGRGAPPSQTPAPGAAKPAAPTQTGQPSNGRPNLLSEWQWWSDSEVQKTLGLAEAKVKNISRIYEDRVRRSQQLLERYETERAELNRLTEERQISVEEYAIHVTQVEALRTELNKGRLVMLYRISRELTPEQNKKLTEIFEKRREAMRNGRGRGTGLHH